MQVTNSDWLNALPLLGCGLRLNERSLQIAVGLLLDANICERHQFPCWRLMQKSCMACHVEGALVGPRDITA